MSVNETDAPLGGDGAAVVRGTREMPAPHYDQDTLNVIHDEVIAWPDMSRIGSRLDADDMRCYLLEMIAEVEYERDRAEASVREAARLRVALREVERIGRQINRETGEDDTEDATGEIVRVARDALAAPPTAGTPEAREGGDRE